MNARLEVSAVRLYGIKICHSCNRTEFCMSLAHCKKFVLCLLITNALAVSCEPVVLFLIRKLRY